MLRRSLIGLGCAGLLAACTPSRPELAGWIAGCAQVESGPTCVISAAPELADPITVFVHNAYLPASVTLGEVSIPATVTGTQGGVRVELGPIGPGQLTVRAANGRFTARITDSETADPEGIRTSTQARADLRAGNWAAAVRGLDRAATLHAQRGAWSRAVSDMLTASYALLYSGHQPHEAWQRLKRAEPWLKYDRDGWARHPYYQGLQAIGAADPSAAIPRLLEARGRLSGRGQTSLVAGVDEVLAVVLQQLGRRDEAEAALGRLRAAQDGGPCAGARRENNAAWASLLAADAHQEAPPPAVQAALEGVVATYLSRACQDDARLSTALLHLAMASVLSGRHEDAQDILRQLPTGDDRLDTLLWRIELEARAEIGLGQARAAQARLQDGLASIPVGELPDAEWRLQIWRARALRAEGEEDAALKAYERADLLLDNTTLRIPFGEGRAPFAQARRQGTAEWAELLLDQGDAARAACVLRTARARVLAQAAQQARLHSLAPEARAAWELHIGALRQLRAESEAEAQTAWGLAAQDRAGFEAAQAARQAKATAHLSTALAMVEATGPRWSCEGLPSPGEGELTLIFVRGARGPLGLSVAEGGTQVHRYAPGTARQGWLAPFDAALAVATRVRFVVEAGPEFTRPHAWPWRGRPLNAQRPVVFSLDLTGERIPSKARADLAVIVADPERNLAGARAEAAGVRRRLDEAGWQVESLQGEMAGPQQVRDGLRRASLLHYCGHGRRYEGSPWADRLGLHRGELSVRDILSVQAVPAQVILTGCRTGSESGLGEVERVGIAQAFLLAGAQQVLGATSDVADQTAAEVGTGVHPEPGQGPLDLAESFHRVAARLDARGDGDWAAFRVWVP